MSKEWKRREKHWMSNENFYVEIDNVRKQATAKISGQLTGHDLFITLETVDDLIEFIKEVKNKLTELSRE